MWTAKAASLSTTFVQTVGAGRAARSAARPITKSIRQVEDVGRTVGAKHREIAQAQRALWEELPWTRHLSISEAAETCWGCGWGTEGFKPEKAHIVADALGGTTSPSNILLLCSRCHDDHPDGASYEDQLYWLRHRDNWWQLTMPAVEKLMSALREEGSDLEIAAWMKENGGAKTFLDSVRVSGWLTSASKKKSTVWSNTVALLIKSFRQYLEDFSRLSRCSRWDRG